MQSLTDIMGRVYGTDFNNPIECREVIRDLVHCINDIYEHFDAEIKQLNHRVNRIDDIMEDVQY